MVTACISMPTDVELKEVLSLEGSPHTDTAKDMAADLPARDVP